MPSITLVDTTSTQTLTNKTLTAPTITGASVALAAAPVTALEAATKSYVDGLNTTPLLNASLAASVGSNTLTLALKTAGGSTPSATDPCRVTFRNGTDTDGSLVTRTVTSATTLSFASGSTLGTSNATAARIWVGLIDNAGTVELCAWNPYLTASSHKSVKGFAPNTDVTTTAEGSGTATSAHVLYSTNARSTVPFVLLGFIEITEATAGVWATAPTVVQTYRDGMRKTGDIVQSISVTETATSTGATLMPHDNTIPQNTEGDQYLSAAITPTSAINLLDIWHGGQYEAVGGACFVSTALFQDTTANALMAKSDYHGANAENRTMYLRHRMVAGTTSSTTLKIRTGASANSLRFNGASAAGLFNGVLFSFLQIEEIYV